jgi:branched-chain amino acid transport system substrate-binding protein
MKRNLKGIIILGFALLITITGINSATAQIDWQPAPESIEIGGSIMASGPSALEGDVELRNWQIAVETINENGGINGIPAEIVYEDNQGTNPGAIAATNILVYDEEVMSCFITVKSTINHALNPLIAEAEVPGLFGGSAWSVRELGNPWMFGFRTNDRNVANIMAKFIVEDLEHTKVASIYSDEAFGAGGNEETIRALKEYEIEPLTVQRFQRNTDDYTAQLLAIKESGAECIFSWSANPEDDGIILRQIKQLGLDVDLVGSASYGMLDVTAKIAGDDAEGIYSVIDISPSDPNPVIQRLDKQLNDRFGYRVGATTWMYDAMIILADAIERAGVIEEIDGQKMIMPVEDARIAIRDALKEVDNFNEGTTKPYTCDEINDLSHSMTIVQIENGEHKVIRKIDLMED